MADSLAALETYLLDSLAQTRGTILNPSKMGGLFTTKLESKYYIIVGAFRGRSYAERKLTSCKEAGYTGTIISFRNGLLAVGVCPSNDLNESLKTLKLMRGTGDSPLLGTVQDSTGGPGRLRDRTGPERTCSLSVGRPAGRP